jgi:hypothetical protein
MTIVHFSLLNIIFLPYRIEYDAYRTDLELLAQAPRTDINAARLEEAQQNYDLHKVNFEKLRSDVSIKLKFLDENRVNIF